MIKKISNITGLSETIITDFFETWKDFYDIDNGLTAQEFSEIIVQHFTT